MKPSLLSVTPLSRCAHQLGNGIGARSLLRGKVHRFLRITILIIAGISIQRKHRHRYAKKFGNIICGGLPLAAVLDLGQPAPIRAVCGLLRLNRQDKSHLRITAIADGSWRETASPTAGGTIYRLERKKCCGGFKKI